MNATPAAPRRTPSLTPRTARPRRARSTFYAVGETAPTAPSHAGNAGILAAHRSGLLEHFTA